MRNPSITFVIDVDSVCYFLIYQHGFEICITKQFIIGKLERGLKAIVRQ